MDTGYRFELVARYPKLFAGIIFGINVGMIGVYCLCFGLDFKRSISGWGDLLGFGGFLLWFFVSTGEVAMIFSGALRRRYDEGFGKGFGEGFGEGFDEGQSRTLDAVMVKLRDRGIDEGMCEAVAREVLALGKDVKNGRSE